MTKKELRPPSIDLRLTAWALPAYSGGMGAAMLRAIGRVAAMSSVTLLSGAATGCGSVDSEGSLAPSSATASGHNWPAGAIFLVPPERVPEPVRSELIELATFIADELCGRALSCCSSLQGSANRSCLDGGIAAWEAVRAFPPDANLNYEIDVEQVANCRAEVAALPLGCAAYPGFTLSSPRKSTYNEAFQHCTAVLKVWEVDTEWEQCDSDILCQYRYGEELGCLDGHCVPLVTGVAGDPCLPRAGIALAAPVQCGPGLYCAQNGLCEPFALEGEDCYPRRCAEGLECEDLNGEDYHCVPLPRLGEFCSWNTLPCGRAQDCVPDAPMSYTGVCRERGMNGEIACSEDFQCKYECRDGFCDTRRHHFCYDPY